MGLKNDGIRIVLETLYKNKRVDRVSSISKRRILLNIQGSVAKDVKQYSVSVDYKIPKRNILNEGVYLTKKKLLQAYHAFTNKGEVEFAKEYWKNEN